ncbi:TPA: hypothetical protein ACSCYS_004277 [Aeromonas veronii]
MTPHEQEAALAAQFKKFDSLDVWAGVVFFMLGVIAFVYSAYDAFSWYTEKGTQKDLSILPVIVLAEFSLIGVPVILFGHLMGKAIRRYVPRYIIDESDPTVIKLIGEVRLTEYGRAKKVLLSKRKGCLLAKNAYEQYGCTMAAVPATDDELKAQKELEKCGIVI